MRRIFGAYAYGPGPRNGCWWDDTIEIAPRAPLAQSEQADVAIVGAGFTGLSAGLHLAEAGVRVVVLEAERIGWGASGRNGGFCCLGGGIADDAEMDARFGKDARLEFRAAEKRAVHFVEALIERHELDVDRHSRGETELAHRPKDMNDLHRSAARMQENYGIEAEIAERGALPDMGMRGGPFFGALTIPVGFGLNPRKYIAGLARLAEQAGATIFEGSAVRKVSRGADGWTLRCGDHEVAADQVIVATNGYSSEDMPDWMSGRYIPGQSTVLVTRPLSDTEIAAQGWHSDQMSYDTRHLLHYFRLMPDRRFLFGMRGALLSGAGAEARARALTRRHFERMFPAWAQVPTDHRWSGMVCLARNKVPFVGEVPGSPGLWTSMCYHGNGVAMASFCGKLLAERIRTGASPELPQVMQQPLTRFPFGRWRRVVMPPLYANLMLQDR